MINRRQFIATLSAVALMPKQFLQAKGFLSPNVFTVPNLAKSTKQGKDVYFDLTIKSGKSKFFPNLWTKTWGVNQSFLGETLKVKRGDNLHIKVKNTLNETTTIHWHGAKLPAKADGGPHQPIAPNATWLSEFEIIQDASTLWYHAHQMHKTGAHVYNGLAGMFIVADEQSTNLDLPNEYGVDDLPVIIQDRDFNKNGSFRYKGGMRDTMMGKMGSVILVNGVVNPVLKAQKSLLRLRLLNGSNARTYNLQFDDNRVFNIIASDGGLLEKPFKTKNIRLAPAERVEILVDISDERMPTLIHKQASNGMRGGMMGMMGGGGGDFNIFQIDSINAKPSAHKIPTTLVKHKKVDLTKVDNYRSFNLEMKMGPMAMFGDAFSINGKAMDINRIDEVVKAGSVEVWTITNSSMMPHPFHIHNVQFKIISRRGGVGEVETGFKDVVLVNPGERVRVYLEFPEFSDKKVPYMYHCHILEHEDGGMMGQFTVV